MKHISLKSIITLIIIIEIIIFPFQNDIGGVFIARGGQTETASPKVDLKELGVHQTSHEIEAIFLDQDLLYVANTGEGLIILNISAPGTPKKISNYNVENAVDVIVNNNIAYVLHKGEIKDYKISNDTLVLINVAIPASPIKIGDFNFSTHGDVGHLYVAGNIAFVTTSDTLFSIDVSNPSRPTKIGDFDFGMSNLASPYVTVVDNVAYVGGGSAGLHILDVRNPSNPVQIGDFDTSGWAVSPVVIGNILYITEWQGGLEIIDISIPTNPIKLGHYGMKEKALALDVALVDNIAYITYYTYQTSGDYGTQGVEESGIIAVDISDPGSPIKVGEYTEMNFASDINAGDELLYVADENDICIFKSEISDVPISGTDGEESGDGFLSWSSLWLILEPLAIVFTAIIAVMGYLKYRKTKRRLNYHLQEIDDVYIEYKTNIKALERGLLIIKAEIKSELKRNVLNEAHYMILDKRVDEYLIEIHEKTEQDIEHDIKWD